MYRLSKKVRQAGAFAIFWLLALIFMVLVTYLVRPTLPIGRINILNYYSEPDNTLDVVYMGASGSYRYYNPLKAWDTSGFTSFMYGVAGMQAANYITGLEDITKSQSPQVVVVDARRFTTDNYAPEMEGAFFRYLDSLDVGWDRFKGVLYSCSVYGCSPFDKEAITGFFDLIRYHSNYWALHSKEHWKYILNRSLHRSVYKGYHLTDKVVPQKPFPGMTTQEEGELNEMAMRVYTDFLEYIKEQDYETVLVVSPMRFSKKVARQYNTLERIAEENDVVFLNLNTEEIYEQMGLDFNTDFYNAHHMNVYGADKYTKYIAEYLTGHYQLEDHRGSEGYEDWTKCYEEYKLAKQK